MINIDAMLDDVETILDTTAFDHLAALPRRRAIARRLIDRIGLQVQADTMHDVYTYLMGGGTKAS